ncbi:MULTISPECIES: helix-turn-helix transcriptional regulator [unclassified Streptomyces]|uniref:helix-turn-helix domain-containing protein n=1 Tax=unclassified Streptomyces TaxID=2593676 RepID=UPI002ED0E495|nr:helix-turn-helix domain-containing protein [Streptomyces sp. NBC_00891]WSY07378.1 helix-turn-helix domain-containing protein [Streptomyces sp. NBC_00890]WSZ09003.1 helix-turn-helix domain-containing protein [Streptomyces sp. NBC_00869]WSZ23498.1 helix-turn-helix domain-containing protein [Streptomyces sp. NBC_00870]
MAAHHDGTRASGEPEPSDSLQTFGAVLKALREAAGLTQEEFAPRVRYSSAYIAKIEQGKRFPPEDLPDRAAEALDPLAGKVLAAAARSLRRRAGLASWFLQWAGIEEEAITLYAYECRGIPGLLQTEGYIRAVFDRRLPPLSQEQFEQQVFARQQRQELLHGCPNTSFSFIIEQAVLQRQLGGPAVTSEVIDNLLAQGSRRNVEIQIMPLEQPDHSGIDGQMYLAESPSHSWFGYVEGHDSSTLLTDPKVVSAMLQRYGKMRSQALSHEATVGLLKQLQGAR